MFDILESANFNKAIKAGVKNPFETTDGIVLFNGSNNDAKSREISAAWKEKY